MQMYYSYRLSYVLASNYGCACHAWVCHFEAGMSLSRGATG